MTFDQTTTMVPGQNQNVQKPQYMQNGQIPQIPRLPLQGMTDWMIKMGGGKTIGDYQKQTQQYNQGMGYGTTTTELPSGGYMHQFPAQTPQAMQMLQMILSQGMQGLQGMPKPQFGPIAEKYEQNYRNSMPSISERFAALGGEGVNSSSGYKSAMAGAEAGLHQQLAGMEQQFNQQNMAQLLQMLGLGLTPQFGMATEGEKPGMFAQMVGPAVSAAGATAPLWMPALAAAL